MGYHCNLPRCLVYAPRTFGRIGLCNLQTEMEVQQITILLHHMRAQTPLGQAIEILIRQYQLWAGVSQPILQDTTPYSWIPDRWLSWLRRTMNEHNIQIRYSAWVIQPLRRHDVFLMEAISKLGLTPQQLEQVNACRMYLQVTTLADITDHTGTLILPQAISNDPKLAPTGLRNVSSSTLQWPTIHPPSQASWNLWTKTICNLFSGAARNTKLSNPLGIWLTNYQEVRMWHWRLSPLGSLLHQANSTVGTRAALLLTTRRNQMTFSLTVPTNQEFNGTPVTPSDKAQRTISRPIPGIEYRPPTTLRHDNHRTLVEQFRTMLAGWQKPLFGPIRRLQPNPSLLQVTQARGNISLISDASVQKTKQSGFAWILAHGHRPLWRGVGLAPGPAADIYSGRAEAFGLLAGLTFLQYYIHSYGPQQFQATQLQCYCDNIGVITNVQKLFAPTHLRPNDTTGDDWDLYLTISNMARQCIPLRPIFIHVKGHQDKDPHRVLTVIEQYNVECDTRAKRYTTNATQRSTSYNNPAIPDAQPHLWIQGKLVCRNLLPALRQEIDFPPYRTYLRKKFQWTKSDANDIHWEVFNDALRSYPTEDQRRIILFVNNKLPLKDSKAHPHMGSHKCPSCQRDNEDEWHFLECTHPARATLYQTLHQDLTQISQKLRLHPCILTTLWLGLTTIRNDTSYPDIAEDIPLQLRTPVCQQTRLGWEQLYHGCLSRAWAIAINATHPHLDRTGEQVLVMMQKQIWKYVLATWSIRNQHLHHQAATLSLPDYRQAAISLYEQQHRLPPAAQEALYRQPLEVTLALPPARLEQWVTRGYKYYNQQIKAAKYQATLQTKDIRSFYGLQTHQHDDLQPP